MKVLGVDPSLRSSGIAAVESRDGRLCPLAYDLIRNTRTCPASRALLLLFEGVTDWLTRYLPDSVAIEGMFYCKNVRTARVLGEARGVVLAACAGRGVPVFEYAPRRVKQALAGNGAAEKEQVRAMVMRLLNLKTTPPEDASDALALALCHLHHGRPAVAALRRVQPL